MKVLLVHNYYQHAGGEDQVVATEGRLLAARGCDVIYYREDNDRIDTMRSVHVAARTIWSRDSYLALRDLTKRHRPQIAHFHNTLPLVSPSAYYAVRSQGAAVVQTLHNYRLLCPNGLFFRNGGPCEDCLTKTLTWPAILHRCYRNSRKASAVVTGMLAFHRALGTWNRKIDRYVALSEFARQKFIAGGLPAQKIVVKPNFLFPDPPLGLGAGGYALFAGRLSAEKGIVTLLDAWRRVGERMELRIAGDGPLKPEVLNAAAQLSSLRYLGHRTQEEISKLMGEAACIVFPSLWYEGGMPRTLIEALSTGTPIIASRLGPMASIIADEEYGLLFQPGNAADLAAKVDWVLTHPQELQEMRAAARGNYEATYTAEGNFAILMDIYNQALASAKNTSPMR